MKEYKDILAYLAANPPSQDSEKGVHASILEMLAKRLRDELRNFKPEALTKKSNVPNYIKRYH